MVKGGNNMGWLKSDHWLDTTAAAAGWGIYLGYSMLYCAALKVLVEAQAWNVLHGVSWSLEEWGVWVLLTPWVFVALRLVDARAQTVWPVFIVAAAVLCLTLGYRAGWHYVRTDSTLPQALVLFLPKYLVATVMVVGGWFFVLRPKQHEKQTTAEDSESNAQQTLPPTILAYKGKDACLVHLSTIDSVSAAGNYLDIHCGQDQYLVRSTLKDFEQRLPADNFVRVHRSHIVQVAAIERIRREVTGTGDVILRSGRTLNVSKAYFQRLKNLHQTRPELVH